MFRIKKNPINRLKDKMLRHWKVEEQDFEFVVQGLDAGYLEMLESAIDQGYPFDVVLPTTYQRYKQRKINRGSTIESQREVQRKSNRGSQYTEKEKNLISIYMQSEPQYNKNSSIQAQRLDAWKKWKQTGEKRYKSLYDALTEDLRLRGDV